MTQPLHYSKRFFIFIIFFIIFLVFIPVVILYSMGYRLDKGFSLTPTGGLYVFYPQSGAEVYINGVLSDQTSLFERGIFIDDLKTDTFEIEVRKVGFTPWKKTIDIKEKRVSEAYPYLIPQTISTSSLPKFITLNSGTSISNTLYSEVLDLFATSSKATSSIKKIGSSTSTKLVASSTGVVRKDIEIVVDKNKVIASWKGNKDSLPFYFCDEMRLQCVFDFVVTEGNIKHVDFYPGRNDVILYSTKDGIFVTELDKRPIQNTAKLLSGNLEFKELDDRIFIKDKNGYYELLFSASTTLNNPISI